MTSSNGNHKIKTSLPLYFSHVIDIVVFFHRLLLTISLHTIIFKLCLNKRNYLDLYHLLGAYSMNVQCFYQVCVWMKLLQDYLKIPWLVHAALEKDLFCLNEVFIFYRYFFLVKLVVICSCFTVIQTAEYVGFIEIFLYILMIIGFESHFLFPLQIITSKTPSNNNKTDNDKQLETKTAFCPFFECQFVDIFVLLMRLLIKFYKHCFNSFDFFLAKNYKLLTKPVGASGRNYLNEIVH